MIILYEEFEIIMQKYFLKNTMSFNRFS